MESTATATVLMVQQVLRHPRYDKRAEMMNRGGLAVRRLGFERPGGLSDGQWHSIGRIADASYRKRLPAYARAIMKIRRAAVECDIVYGFGLDIGLLVCLATMGIRGGRPQRVAEIGDIRGWLSRPGPMGTAARALERLLLLLIDVVVVTSPEYLTQHYLRRYRLLAERVQFTLIENKVSSSWDIFPTAHTIDERLLDGPLRVGWFGVLRCSDTLQSLRAAAARGVHVIVAGRWADLDGVSDPYEEVIGSGRFSYLGPYSVPDDLKGLYTMVHLVWASYPTSGAFATSAGLARTNRYYEAGAFGIPMVGAYGTAVGNLIEELQVGMVLDTTQPANAGAALANVSISALLTWRSNLLALRKELFTDVDDWRRLRRVLAM